MQHIFQQTTRAWTRRIGVLPALCLVFAGLGLVRSATADAPPVTEWVARTSGDPTAIAVDAAGNVYVTGSDLKAYVTVKYDGTTGRPLWTNRSAASSFNAQPRALLLDGAGNVYVTGYSTGVNSAFVVQDDFLTLKLNGATGQQLWATRYDGPASSGDQAFALGQDGAGNVLVTGYSGGLGTNADYATVKYDGATGQQLWVARYDGPAHGSDQATALAVDAVGNVCVTGRSSRSSSLLLCDFFTVKYNGATGQQIWSALGSAPTNSSVSPTALALDGRGDVFITGSSLGGGSSADYATYKYDGATGQQLWVAHAGDAPLSPRATNALAVDPAGDVFVAGYAQGGSAANQDYITVKYAGGTGQQLWASRYGGVENSTSFVDALALDGAGGVYVTGFSRFGTSPDYATLKYDAATGQQLWTKVFNGPSNRADSATAIAADQAGNVYVTGSSDGTGGNMTTLKYRQDISPLSELTVTATSATFAWETTQPSFGRVEYGLTAAYGSSVAEGVAVTSHRVTISGLLPERLYFFRVTSRLVDGTVLNVKEGRFTTPTATFIISGKVTVGGVGLGGALVLGASQSVTTAPDGTYTLAGVYPGTYLVQAFANGYTFSSRVVQVGPDRTGVDFSAPANPALTGPFTISGKVTVGGVGFGGATIYGAGQTLTTAADGTYSLTNVVTGNYLVQAFAIGYTFANRVVQVGPDRTGVDFSAPANPALTGSYTISGRVSAGGVGVDGALVSGAGQTVYTSADGSYSLTNVGTGNYGIIAWAPEYTFPPQTAQVGPSKSGVDFNGVRITYTVSGKVTVGGANLAGAVVLGGGITATTAADGTYTLSGLLAGSYQVSAFSPGRSFPDRTVAVGPSQTGVDFDGPATISGKVTVAGVSLAGAQVIGAGQNVTTAADGTYKLTGVHAGSYLVQCFAAGNSFPDQVVQVGPDKAGVDFDSPATISGKVTVGGVGFSGAQVIGAGQTVTTAADGTYKLTGVHAGSYLVQCFAIGYTFSGRVVQVGPSQSGVDFAAPFDPALVGPFTISGKVTVGGVGVGGVLVSGAGQTVFTAPDGTYALTNVGTGDYGIIAWAPGYIFPPQTALVGPSKSGVDFAAP